VVSKHPLGPQGASKLAGARWRWVLALGVLGVVGWRLAHDPDSFRPVFAVRPDVLAGLAALVVVNQLLMSQRFSMVLAHCCGQRLPTVLAFRLISVGQMLNLFVPQLGNIYRGVELKRERGVSYLAYASALVGFVWLDLLMGFVIAFAVIAIVDPQLRLGSASVLPAIALTVVAFAIAPAASAKLITRWQLKSGRPERFRARLLGLLATIASLFSSPRLLLQYLLLTIFVTAGQVATLWLAFSTVGAGLSLPALILLQVLLKVSNQLVITPGNLGITELLFGVLALGASCTLEQGLAVSLVLRAVGTVMVVLLGLPLGGSRILVQRWRTSRHSP
jgi:uncharacterized membrane protein YbhN (UPF0104 family)